MRGERERFFKSKEGLTQVFEVRTTFSQVQRSVVIVMSKAWINGAGNQNFLTLIKKPCGGTHFRHAAAAFLVLLKMVCYQGKEGTS